MPSCSRILATMCARASEYSWAISQGALTPTCPSTCTVSPGYSLITRATARRREREPGMITSSSSEMHRAAKAKPMRLSVSRRVEVRAVCSSSRRVVEVMTPSSGRKASIRPSVRRRPPTRVYFDATFELRSPGIESKRRKERHGTVRQRKANFRQAPHLLFISSTVHSAPSFDHHLTLLLLVARASAALRLAGRHRRRRLEQ